MKTNERLSLFEAAKELKTTHLKVLMLLKQNALTGDMIDGEWYVDRVSLDCFLEHGADLQAPGGCRTSCNAKSCGCGGK